nr:hypothetical protein [Lachnospiraceae bacterium]
MMPSLIDEYVENIAKMKLSPDDYCDKIKVKNHNRISVRNRKIAAIINTKNEDLKDDFANLLNSADHDTRLRVAHHILEIMTYDKAIRIKALEIIEEESKNSKDEVDRFGQKIWLQDYYNTHPEDVKQ